MKKYYKFDENGRQLASYARRQSGVEGLELVKKPTFEPAKRNESGNDWIEDTELYGELRISEMESFILNKLLRWSKALTSIQARFNNVFISAVSNGKSFSEIDTLYDDMVTWLYE